VEKRTGLPSRGITQLTLTNTRNLPKQRNSMDETEVKRLLLFQNVLLIF